MKKAKIIISILFLLFTSASLGLGTYFIVSYFNRDKNKEFEAAYIYDTSYSTTVDVDLGYLNPGETKDMSIPVVSLMKRTINVEISFRGEENAFNNYIDVSFDDKKDVKPVSAYINEDIRYVFTLGSEESRDVKIHYSLNKDVSGDTNFTIFIKAVDYSPLSIEVE